MPPYRYRGLDEAKNEIRIAEILPAKFEEAIEIKLVHAPLRSYDDSKKRAISLQEVRAATPPEWLVRETPERRFIFERADSTSENTSWTHPEPEFDNARLEPREPEESSQTYEALSYVWGSPEDPKSILVREGNATQSLPVRSNLYLALQHLRYAHSSRWLWIDALCINQSDIKERGKQVQRMRSIYTCARRVIVWLGPVADESHTALSTLQYLGEQVEITRDFQILRSPGSVQRDWFHSWISLPYDSKTWLAIEKLLERPWFSRLWILQEIQLASKSSVFKCGSCEVLWYHIRRALRCLLLKRHPQFRQSPISGALGQDWSQYNTFMLFTAVSQSQCSDPRDMVYGSLGLAPRWFAERICPDYTLSVADVHKEASLAYLRHTKRLDLLPYAFQGGRQAKAPSWVVDWSGPGLAARGSEDSFACGMSMAHATYRNDEVLDVIGIECTTARSVSEPAPENEEAVLDFVRMQREKHVLKSNHPNGESMEDAYLLTLCRHRTQERFPGNIVPPLEEWRNQLLFKTNVNMSLLVRTLKRIAQQTIIVFENGYIGLGPTSAKRGIE